MRSVVGKDRVDFVGDGGDQMPQEVSRGLACDLLVQLDEGELRCPVDRDEKIELAFGRSDLSNINMEIADRIGPELAPLGSLAFNLRQPRYPVTLQAAMQG